MSAKVKNPWIIVVILVLSTIVATFNETMLNVALISISNDLSVTMATSQWMITGYMMVTSVMVPVTAFLYSSVPTKRLYMIAMLILVLTSIGCFASAIGGSFILLLLLRMLQAVGTGMLIPIMMSTTLLVAPREKVGTAMALCVCGLCLGPAMGPVISGLIVQYLHWSMTFVLIAVLAFIFMLIGMRVI